MSTQHEAEDKEQTVAELVPTEPVTSLRTRIIRHVIFAVVVAGIVAIWVLTPLRHWLDVPRAVEAMRGLDSNTAMPFVMLAAFVIGGLLMFPVNVLTAVCVIIFGAVLGTVYALIGATLSAIALYEIGNHTGRGLLRRVAGGRLNRLSIKMARRGILAVTILRIVPVAPYSVVNLVAGASHIRRRDYIAGTVLGMTPGTILNALLVDRVVDTIRHPQPLNYALLAGAALIFAGASVWLGRRMLRASREKT